jgi:hypothetical protein
VAENLSDTSPGFLLSRILTSPALFASIALWYLLTEIQFLTDFPFLLNRVVVRCKLYHPTQNCKWISPVFAMVTCESWGTVYIIKKSYFN